MSGKVRYGAGKYVFNGPTHSIFDVPGHEVLIMQHLEIGIWVASHSKVSLSCLNLKQNMTASITLLSNRRQRAPLVRPVCSLRGGAMPLLRIVIPRLPSAVSEPRLQCCAVSGLTAFHYNVTLWHKVINLERAK